MEYKYCWFHLHVPFHACDKKCSVKLSNFNVLTAKLPIFFPFRWSFCLAYTSEEVFVLVGDRHQWLFQSTNKAKFQMWHTTLRCFTKSSDRSAQLHLFTGVRRMLSIDAKMVSNTVKLFSFSLETKGFDGPMEHNYFNLMCRRVQ